MKTVRLIILWMVFTGLITFGLTTACNEYKTERQQVQEKIAAEIHEEWTNINKPKVYLFTYKGHDMVYMVLHEGSDHAVGGFFHDPECRKCSGEYTSVPEQTHTLSPEVIKMELKRKMLAQDEEWVKQGYPSQKEKIEEIFRNYGSSPKSEYEEIFGKP